MNDDMISRQAVRLIESDPDAYPQEWNDDYEKGFTDALNKVLALPSAEPERPEQPESAREYCAECDHVEMCRWYPYEGCEFRSLPSAERRGRWEHYEHREPQYDIEGYKTWAEAYKCSNCGFIHTVIEDFGHYAFCPRCGARMEEGGE